MKRKLNQWFNNSSLGRLAFTAIAVAALIVSLPFLKLEDWANEQRF